MNIRTAVKRLEQQMQPPPDCIIYAPTCPLDNNDLPGMIKVTCWSRPGWEEIITCEEHDRRIAEALERGEQILGPGWSDEI
ncbi:MAG: hypothetical protein PHW39_02890 [Syntrophomonadaceae bacterium]|nr:hypothetical protein [Clostridia bacterium]MDD4562008.1 hypothetical protein [Syntrophomonadaceae bacterium]